MGVGGVCVRLLNGSSREVISETSTNSNGYYAFENPKVDSIIQFIKPSTYEFTKSNIGDEDSDSDADTNWRDSDHPSKFVRIFLGRRLDSFRRTHRHTEPDCATQHTLVHSIRALCGTDPFGAIDL